MSFLIRVAIVVLALYVLWRACGRLIRSFGMMTDQKGRADTSRPLHNADELVQDPVCKLYVSRREAIVLSGQGEPLYFCSEKCRDHYVRLGGTRPD